MSDDIASIGIKVDTTEVKTGSSDLDKFTAAAGRTSAATEAMQKSLDQLNRTATQMHTALLQQTRAIEALAAQSREAAAKVDSLEKSTDRLGHTAHGTGGIMGQLSQILAGIGIAKLITDTLNLAKSYEHLGTVSATVARNMGISNAALRESEKAMRESGLTMLEAREAATSMMKANIDLANSSKLAAMANNIAATTGEEAGAVMQKLVTGLKSQRTEQLKSIGVYVDMEEAVARYAAEQHKTVKQVTDAEKQQIKLNEVLAQAAKYESAAADAQGTMLISAKELGDVIEDLQVMFGRLIMPTLTFFLQEMKEKLESVKDAAGDLSDEEALVEWGLRIGRSFVGAVGAIEDFLTKLAILDNQKLKITNALARYSPGALMRSFMGLENYQSDTPEKIDADTKRLEASLGARLRAWEKFEQGVRDAQQKIKDAEGQMGPNDGPQLPKVTPPTAGEVNKAYRAAIVEQEGLQRQEKALWDARERDLKALRDQHILNEEQFLQYKTLLDVAEVKRQEEMVKKELEIARRGKNAADVARYTAELKALADKRVQIEKDGNDAIIKLRQDLADKSQQAFEKDIEAQRRLTEQAEEQHANLGKSKGLLALETAERWKNAAAAAAQNLEAAKAAGMAGPELKQMEEQVRQYQRMAEEAARTADAIANVERDETMKKAAEDAQQEWEKASDNIKGWLTDAFAESFNNGKSLWKSFVQSLKTMAGRLVLNPIIEPVAQAGASMLTSSSANAAMAMAGGNSTSAFGYVAQLKSLYDMLTSGFDKFGASVTHFAQYAQSLSTTPMVSSGAFGSGWVSAEGGLAYEAPSTFATTAGTYAMGTAGFLAGRGVGQALSGGYSISGSGNGLVNSASAIGAYWGPIGSIIGGAVAGALNRTFGRSLTQSGVQGVISGGSYTAQSYDFYKGGFLRGDKTATSPISRDMDNLLGTAIDGMYSSFDKLAKTIGVNTALLDDFSHAFKVNLKGLSAEDAQKALGREMGHAADVMANAFVDKFRDVTTVVEDQWDTVTQHIGGADSGMDIEVAVKKQVVKAVDRLGVSSELDPYIDDMLRLYDAQRTYLAGIEGSEGQLAAFAQELFKLGNTLADTKGMVSLFGSAMDFDQLDAMARRGETVIDTFNRLSAVFQTTNSMLEATGVASTQAFGAVGTASAAARQGLADLAGGIEVLAGGWGFYLQNFYTDAERLAMQQKQLDKTMGELGLSAIKTRDQFREQVKAAMAMGDAGRDLLLKLLAVAPAFDAVADAVESAGGAVASLGAFDFFDQNFQSGAEGVADAIARVDEQLGKLGIIGLRDVDTYRTLVNHFRSMGGAGESMALALAAAAPAFLDMANGIEALKQAQVAAAQEVERAEKSLINARKRVAATEERIAKTYDSLQKRREEYAANEARIAEEKARTEARKAREKEIEELTKLYQDAVNEVNAARMELDDARAVLSQSYQREADALRQTVERMKAFAKSLQDLRNNLKLGSLSPLTPVQRYETARNTALDTVSKAQAGDQDAIDRVTGALQDFLDASRVVNTSGAQYTSDFAWVQDMLNLLESSAGGQQTEAETQLEALRNSVKELIDLNDNVVSVEDAILNVRKEQAELDATLAEQTIAEQKLTTAQQTNELILEQERIADEARAAADRLRELQEYEADAMANIADLQADLVEQQQDIADAEADLLKAQADQAHADAMMIRAGIDGLLGAQGQLLNAMLAIEAKTGSATLADPGYRMQQSLTAMQQQYAYLQGTGPQPAYSQAIRQIYLQDLGREPDAEGWNYWNSQYLSGTSLTDIRNTILKIAGLPSHANGLSYVPYDEYPALLHRGESVKTAYEAREERIELQRYGRGAGNAALCAEIKALRAEVARLREEAAQQAATQVEANFAAHERSAGRISDGMRDATERSDWRQQLKTKLV